MCTDTVEPRHGSIVSRLARAIGAISREHFREKSRIVVLGQEVDRRSPSISRPRPTPRPRDSAPTTRLISLALALALFLSLR